MPGRKIKNRDQSRGYKGYHNSFINLKAFDKLKRYIRIYSKSHHPNILYGLIKKKRFRPEINADGSVT
jgi:hypothetical protein